MRDQKSMRWRRVRQTGRIVETWFELAFALLARRYHLIGERLSVETVTHGVEDKRVLGAEK